MLTRYVLGRKLDLTAPYRSLLHVSWHHDAKLGAGIPHIASTIRTQRLLALQQLMQPAAVRPLWAPLVLDQFAACMGSLYRESHPFDFLLYSPQISSKWIKTTELHPFWVDVWRQWSKTPMASRIAAPPSYDTVMNMPVWLTAYGPMANDTVRHAAQLVRLARGRRWFLHGASRGFRSLRDFMAPNGRWYTWSELAHAMGRDNPSTRVHLDAAGQIAVSAAPHGSAVYKHVTAVYNNVRRQHQVRTDVMLSQPPLTGHPFYKTIKGAAVPFELWPRHDVRALAKHPPAATRPHPLQTPTRRSLTDVKVFVKATRRLLRDATPVHADVWHRLVMHTLPVNSRMAYRQLEDPSAILCSHGCGAVESEIHAFFACPKIYPVWEWHKAAWHAVGTDVHWLRITNLDQFKVHARHARLSEHLHQLWAMAVAVTAHALWQHRNAAHFDNKRLVPQPVLQDTIFVTWLATVRRCLRLLETESTERRDLHAATSLMLTQPGYNTLAAKYPLGLWLRATRG